MIRPETGEDITEEEFKKVLEPFINNYDDYLESYILPEIIAYYLANSYYRNAMYETTWIQKYNSAKNLINLFRKDEGKVIRLNNFRHSCASLLINSGANVTLVAKYLGHTKIEEN